MCAIGADPADVLDNAPAPFASWPAYVAGKKDLIDEVRAAAGADDSTCERGGGGKCNQFYDYGVHGADDRKPDTRPASAFIAAHIAPVQAQEPSGVS